MSICVCIVRLFVSRYSRVSGVDLIKSKSYDLLRMEIYIEHKIFCQLKHDQN